GGDPRAHEQGRMDGSARRPWFVDPARRLSLLDLTNTMPEGMSGRLARGVAKPQPADLSAHAFDHFERARKGGVGIKIGGVDPDRVLRRLHRGVLARGIARITLL